MSPETIIIPFSILVLVIMALSAIGVIYYSFKIPRDNKKYGRKYKAGSSTMAQSTIPLSGMNTGNTNINRAKEKAIMEIDNAITKFHMSTGLHITDIDLLMHYTSRRGATEIERVIVDIKWEDS